MVLKGEKKLRPTRIREKEMKKIIKIGIFFLLLTNFHFGNAQSQDALKDEFKIIIEKFCAQSYDQFCYRYMKYIKNSIIIDSYEINKKNKSYVVKGYHSYYGEDIPFIGRKKHTNVSFYAEIYIQHNNTANVTFYKYYEPDITDIDGHWESCGPITVQHNTSTIVNIIDAVYKLY